jgi:hypothetical protein
MNAGGRQRGVEIDDRSTASGALRLRRVPASCTAIPGDPGFLREPRRVPGRTHAADDPWRESGDTIATFQGTR